jgi:hypothetical protein
MRGLQEFIVAWYMLSKRTAETHRAELLAHIWRDTPTATLFGRVHYQDAKCISTNQPRVLGHASTVFVSQAVQSLRLYNKCWIWGSHSSDYQKYVLGCNAV